MRKVSTERCIYSNNSHRGGLQQACQGTIRFICFSVMKEGKKIKLKINAHVEEMNNKA